MIKEKIYDYFKDKALSREISPDSVAPSYMTDCRRKIFYTKTGVTPSNLPSEAAFFKMEIGSSSHAMIQGLFKDIGILEQCEDLKEIEYAGLKWKYRLDGILNIEGKKYIVEIKTVYGAGYNSIENEPKPEHKWQALMYAIFENIPNIIILYVGRDNGHMVEYVYEDMDLENVKFNGKIERLRKLMQDIQDKSLPARDFSIVLKNKGGEYSEQFTRDKVKYRSDWRCGYCPYKLHCWEDVYKDMADYDFYINGEFIKE